MYSLENLSSFPTLAATETPEPSSPTDVLAMRVHGTVAAEWAQVGGWSTIFHIVNASSIKSFPFWTKLKRRFRRPFP